MVPKILQISAARSVPGILQISEPEWCQKSCRFLQPEWCQKSCRFLQPEWCQKSCRFVLSLTWNNRNLNQNPWRSSRDDIALYPGTFRESIWACSCVIFALQLGSFESAKWLPRGFSAKIPVLARKRGQRPMAKTGGIVAESPRGSHFADSKDPSCSTKITQLQAQIDSRKVPG